MSTSKPKTRDGVIVTRASKLWTGVEICPPNQPPDFEFFGAGFFFPRSLDLSEHPTMEIALNQFAPSIGWGLKCGLVFYSLDLYFSSREAAWQDFLKGVDKERRSLNVIANQNMAGDDDDYLAMLEAEDQSRAKSLTEAFSDGKLLKDLIDVLKTPGFAKLF